MQCLVNWFCVLWQVSCVIVWWLSVVCSVLKICLILLFMLQLGVKMCVVLVLEWCFVGRVFISFFRVVLIELVMVLLFYVLIMCVLVISVLILLVVNMSGVRLKFVCMWQLILVFFLIGMFEIDRLWMLWYIVCFDMLRCLVSMVVVVKWWFCRIWVIWNRWLVWWVMCGIVVGFGLGVMWVIFFMC